MFSGGRTNTAWWELKAWGAEGQAPGARVGEVDWTETMCSVLNTLHTVSTRGAEKVCSSALPIEPDRWSREFYLEHHSALRPAHPFVGRAPPLTPGSVLQLWDLLKGVWSEQKASCM